MKKITLISLLSLFFICRLFAYFAAPFDASSCISGRKVQTNPDYGSHEVLIRHVMGADLGGGGNTPPKNNEENDDENEEPDEEPDEEPSSESKTDPISESSETIVSDGVSDPYSEPDPETEEMEDELDDIPFVPTDEQLTETELSELKQKLANEGASMSENERMQARKKIKSLEKQVEQNAQNEGGTAGDPVYVASGRYTDFITDSSIRCLASSFDITRTYTSNPEHMGSFGKNWISSLDARLIFGISSITESVCNDFYSDILSVTENELSRLIKNYTQSFGKPESSWSAISGEISNDIKTLYTLLVKISNKKKKIESRIASGGLLPSSLFTRRDELNLMLDQTKNKISNYTSWLPSCTKTESIIRDYQNALSEQQVFYSQLLAQSETNLEITSQNAQALFAGTPDYCIYTGTETITFIDGTGCFHSFTTSGTSVKNGVVSAPQGSVWISETDPVYSSITKTQNGFILSLRNNSSLSFSASGLLTSVTDAYGNAVFFSRDDNGILSNIYTSTGETYSVTYCGNVISSISACSKSDNVLFTYSEECRITSVTDRDGDTVCYSWTNGLLSSIQKPDGSSICFSFDATDGNGNPLTTETRNEEGYSEFFEYDPGRNTTLHTDHSGVKTLYAFDALHQITEIKYADGKHITRTYSDGLLISENANGSITRYDYDAFKRIIRISYSDGTFEAWNYDDSGFITAYRERNGAYAVYTRNRAGDITSLTVDGQLSLTRTYTPGGLIETETLYDDETNFSRFEYDESGNMTKAASGDETGEWTWNQNGQVSSYRINGKLMEEYTYDGRNQTILSSSGLQTVYTVNERKDTVRIEETDVRTGETRVKEYEYDKRHLITALYAGNRDSRTLVERYRYDGEGRKQVLVSYRGSKAAIILYEYMDKDGIMLSEPSFIKTFTISADEIVPEADYEQLFLDATDGCVWSFETAYTDSGNRKVTVTDPRGFSTSYLYDPWNNLLSDGDDIGVFFPETGTSEDAEEEGQEETVLTLSYSYDPAERVLTITEGGYYETKYLLNAWGETVSLTDGNGNTTCYGRDYSGNIISVTDAYGNMTRSSFNQAGQLVQIDYPDGSFQCFEYDFNGKLTKLTDQAGVVVSQDFDSEGNLLHKTGRGITDTLFTYDCRNRLVSMSENGSCVLTNEYSTSDGQCLSRDAKGNVISFQYDENETDAVDEENSPVYVYDGGNKLILQKNLITGSELSYSYDKAGNCILMSDGIQTTEYYYGKNNELTGITEKSNGMISAQITFTYDALGRETSRSFGNGVCQTTTYNEYGNVSLIVQRDISGRLLWGEGFVYDENGRITASVDSDISVTLSSYDDRGRLSGLFESETEGAENVYLPSGVFQELQSLLNQMKSTLGNSLSVLQIGSTTEYEYDENSNRTAEKTASGIIRYEYDSDNRLISAGSSTYSFDSSGNLISENTPSSASQFVYSSGNRMVQSTLSGHSSIPDTVIYYQYDYLGRRISETEYQVSQQGNYVLKRYETTEYEGLSFNPVHSVFSD